MHDRCITTYVSSDLILLVGKYAIRNNTTFEIASSGGAENAAYPNSPNGSARLLTLPVLLVTVLLKGLPIFPRKILSSANASASIILISTYISDSRVNA